MSEEQAIPFQVYGEARGEYTFMIENKRFTFTFAITNTFKENLVALSLLQGEIQKAIEIADAKAAEAVAKDNVAEEVVTAEKVEVVTEV